MAKCDKLMTAGALIDCTVFHFRGCQTNGNVA